MKFEDIQAGTRWKCKTNGFKFVVVHKSNFNNIQFVRLKLDDIIERTLPFHQLGLDDISFEDVSVGSRWTYETDWLEFTIVDKFIDNDTPTVRIILDEIDEHVMTYHYFLETHQPINPHGGK